MNFELREQLDKLHDSVENFIDFADEHMAEDDDHGESEFSFLVDESGISNTDIDNFLETLQHVTDFIEKLK